MKVLLFDNYDSFTYNLLHILKELGAEVEVHRNDKISLDEVERFDKMPASSGMPGPGDKRILSKRSTSSNEILSLRCTSTSAPNSFSICNKL